MSRLFGRQYPIIIIPELIANSCKKVLTDNEIISILKLDIPKIKKNKYELPSYPSEYTYKNQTITKISEDFKENFKISLISGIMLCAFWLLLEIIIGLINFNEIIFSKNWVINFFQSLLLVWICIILFSITLVFILSIGNISYTYEKTHSTKINSQEYQKSIEEYNNLLTLHKQENKRLQSTYDEEISQFKKNIAVNRKLITQNEYLNNLKPSLKSKEYYKVQTSDNIDFLTQKGKAEYYFYNYLLRNLKIRDYCEIFIDYPKIYKYFPDIVITDNQTELHINIEIDEPYIYGTNVPTHYLDDSKIIDSNELRDLFFSKDCNWIIIRFSEEQIIRQPKECCNLIDQVISKTINKEFDFTHNVNKSNRWNLNTAKQMSIGRYRDSYLHLLSK